MHDFTLLAASEASWRATWAKSAAHAVGLGAIILGKLKGISVEYAIMEKARRVAVVDAQPD